MPGSDSRRFLGGISKMNFLDVRMIAKVMNGVVKAPQIVVVAVDSDSGIVSG